MTASPLDPRTEDTIVYELVRTHRATNTEEPAGRAIFANGRTRVEAEGDVRVAVEELLARAFVDRVEADERPRGYRRSGQGMVDMLVPGMPEHFIARMRGLWLPYPDGTVVTARAAEISRPRPGAATSTAIEPVEAGPPVTDASVRRATLADSEAILNVRPLLRANPPLPGVRPPEERSGVARTDCGWLV